MKELLRSWKRRFGLVTLLIACLFMFAWLRSLGHLETIHLPLAQGCVLNWISFDGRTAVGMISFQTAAPANNSFQWIRATMTQEVLEQVLNQFTWDWRWGDFRWGVARQQHPVEASNTLLIVPYWAIVVPLGLLSARLLLTKTSMRHPVLKPELSQGP